MRVLFDEQVFLLQKRGGVSRYFVELIKQFLTNPELNVEPQFNFKSTSNQLLLDLSREFDLGIIKDSRPKPLALAAESASSVKSHTSADLIHHTFYSKLFWQPRYKGPRISTHYDMIPELFNESRFGINPHLSKRWYFNHVNQILSISNSAKEDLLKIWPEIETPIAITHLGKPEVKFENLPRIKGQVLFVGVRGGYKDAELLIRAFAALPANLKSHLQFIGGGPFSEKEKQLLDDLDIAGFVSQSNASDSELVHAYQTAHLFVFTSRYEGFGLPALESLQLGCQTLLSRTPALEEVAGEAALYFNAGSIEDLTKKLIDVLSHDPNSNPLKDSGFKRVEDFSWRKTALKSAEIYDLLAGQNFGK